MPTELQTAINWISENYTLVLIGLLVFVALMVLVRLVGRAIEALLEVRSRQNDNDEEILKRARTLTRVIRNMVIALFALVAFVYFLTSIGVDLGPILVGAGVAGVALGFGAQKLIQDFLNGFFILIENQYRVGDVIQVDGVKGLVEGVVFRTTILRDYMGVVHTIPNSQVTTVSNLTKGFSRYMLDVGVAYKEKVDHVIEVLKEIGAGMDVDETWGREIIEPTEVWGVENFGDSAVVIRMRFTTKPSRQWEVAREFRRRIKNKFDELGIEIPFPHRTLYFGQPVDQWMAESGQGRSQ